MAADHKRYAKTKTELAAHIPKLNRETGEIEHGISLTALSNNWMKKPDAPTKTAHGFDIPQWQQYVLSRIEIDVSKLSGDELDDQKKREQIANIKVQRARNEENLKQDQLKTKQLHGKLVERAEVDREASRVGSMIRGRIDAFRQHQTAKHPNLKADIDRFCDDMMEDIRLALVS